MASGCGELFFLLIPTFSFLVGMLFCFPRIGSREIMKY